MSYINLNKLVSRYINKPTVVGKDGVLYTHIDGYTGDLNAFEQNAMKDIDVVTIGKHTYSSPTNVRRVFISGSRVLLQTYKPFMKNGEPDSRGCWYSYKFKEDENVFKKIDDIYTYGIKLVQYKEEKQRGNVNAVAPEKVNLVGNIFSAFSKPWVLSNIEEIYIDWTFLASENILNSLGEVRSLVDDCYFRRRYGKLNTDVLKKAFHLVNDNTSFRNRYPRLRNITMISELDKILETDFYKSDLGEYDKLWIENRDMMELVKRSNSLIVINLFEDLTLPNREFFIREGIYKFDKEVLVDFKEKLLSDLKGIIVDNKKRIEVEEDKLSDVEKYLRKVEAERGLNVVKLLFNLALADMTKSSREEILGSITEEYRVKLKYEIA